MLKRLFINLFVTFVFSSVITVAALRLSFYIDEGFVRARLDTNPRDLPGFVIEANVILFITALPALALANNNIRNNKYLRPLLFYFGPALLLVYFTYLPIRFSDVNVWVLFSGPIIIFLAIHAYYYTRLTEKGALSDNHLPALKDLP